MSEHNVKTREASAVRHSDVTRDLLEGISSGRFPVGSLLPTELELCERYGTSRHTIRVAITELVDLGLVTRRKRAGTRVEAKTPPERYRQLLTSLDDLVQFGTTHLRVVKDMADHVMSKTLAEALGCEPGSQWVRVSSLRIEGAPRALPSGWTDVYVAPDYREIVDEMRASPGVLAATLIERRFGCRVSQIFQDITAVAMPARLAGPLEADVGSPALRVVRRYIDAGSQTIELSDTVHPAGRFTASSRLERGRTRDEVNVF